MSETRSYYGRPVIKEPVWTPEIPVYFFTGGLAGAASGLAWLAGRQGDDELARRAWVVALAGAAASPALLISDLGRPSRFLNMLRMFKVTSPMSVGSWILSGAGTAIAVSAVNALTGLLPRLSRAARPAAAGLGLPLATYTGALIANTAVPAWHDARKHLPFLFAAGAAASAGAAVVVVAPVQDAGPARRLAVWGAAAEILVASLMEEHLGEIGEVYHQDQAGTAGTLAKVATAVGGAAVAATGGRSRVGAVLGGATILLGAMSERWAVFRAGSQSAADPKYTVRPQRERVEAGRGRGASRKVPA